MKPSEFALIKGFRSAIGRAFKMNLTQRIQPAKLNTQYLQGIALPFVGTIKITLIGLLIVTVTSCASFIRMPLTHNVEDIDLSRQGVLFGRIIIVNQNKPGQQPELEEIIIRKNNKQISFIKPFVVEEAEGLGKQYIFSMIGESGDATLEYLRFTRRSYLMHGTADLPFKQKITFSNRQFIYIGNIFVSILPRKEGEPRAGDFSPLFDQFISGFFDGTFQVSVRDFAEPDTALARKHFPFIDPKRVAKRILKPWSYPKEEVQK